MGPTERMILVNGANTCPASSGGAAYLAPCSIKRVHSKSPAFQWVKLSSCLWVRGVKAVTWTGMKGMKGQVSHIGREEAENKAIKVLKTGGKIFFSCTTMFLGGLYCAIGKGSTSQRL